MEEILNVFSREQLCEYKGRRYLVRDNGAVYRYCKEDGRRSKWDEKWTFGRFDSNTGYMLIGQERVHRIVCIAYYGEPVGDRNIVDHIDTNRCNNRQDNLRWVTKLENALLNPITRAKIELICGSIEAYLENPSLLYGHESENPNFVWMRAVTKEEAKRSLERWKKWAEKPIEERKSKGERKGPGEWIYKSWEQQKTEIAETKRRIIEKQYGLKDSLTLGAKQLNWKMPTEFLLCPQKERQRTLQAYLDNLEKGKNFSRTEYYDGGTVLDKGYNPEEDAIYVLTYNEEAVKPWALCKITLQDGCFIHDNRHSFFKEDGGKKYFTLAMGKEWTDGMVFNDYC